MEVRTPLSDTGPPSSPYSSSPCIDSSLLNYQLDLPSSLDFLCAKSILKDKGIET